MDRLYRATLNSLRGLKAAAMSEAAMRQELALLALALPLAAWLARDIATFAVLISAVLLLLAVELLNTAIEKLCDHVTPEHHASIGRIKDIASAAVFAAILIVVLVWGAAVISRVWGV